ncbi:MAG: ATP-binding cassette domain-containing protein, partial [Hyphomicrobiales bacterium]|nr:ATP-binding cassette domain-containing protein [Hyphomicrobiales bacterium]
MERPIVLEARGLCKNFGSFAVVDDVNLQVAEGSIHVLIGPNGAGKTTLFN